MSLDTGAWKSSVTSVPSRQGCHSHRDNNNKWPQKQYRLRTENCMEFYTFASSLYSTTFFCFMETWPVISFLKELGKIFGE